MLFDILCEYQPGSIDASAAADPVKWEGTRNKAQDKYYPWGTGRGADSWVFADWL